jgi:hypothetical protein
VQDAEKEENSGFTSLHHLLLRCSIPLARVLRERFGEENSSRRHRGHRMWGFISQYSFATAIIDFTDELSSLLVGLMAVVWLSAGFIAIAALQHFLAQTPAPRMETTPAPIEYQAAA